MTREFTESSSVSIFFFERLSLALNSTTSKPNDLAINVAADVLPIPGGPLSIAPRCRLNALSCAGVPVFDIRKSGNSELGKGFEHSLLHTFLLARTLSSVFFVPIFQPIHEFHNVTVVTDKFLRRGHKEWEKRKGCEEEGSARVAA